MLIAVDLLEAAKAGNSTALEETEAIGYANADEIATSSCTLASSLLRQQEQLALSNDVLCSIAQELERPKLMVTIPTAML